MRLNTPKIMARIPALLSLSTSLRSIAPPPRVYDIERLRHHHRYRNHRLHQFHHHQHHHQHSTERDQTTNGTSAPPAAPAAPAPATLHQQQQCEKRKKTIATNASKDNIFTAGIHPAPSMSSRERLVQLVERNVQDARFSEEDAVEKDDEEEIITATTTTTTTTTSEQTREKQLTKAAQSCVH